MPFVPEEQCVHAGPWQALAGAAGGKREVVGEKTCRAVVALLTCGSRSIRAREAVSVRGGRAAVLRGSAPHERFNVALCDRPDFS